jgi:hypothetical protein
MGRLFSPEWWLDAGIVTVVFTVTKHFARKFRSRLPGRDDPPTVPLWRAVANSLVVTGLTASILSFFHVDTFMWAVCSGMGLAFVADDLIQARKSFSRTAT